MTAPSDGVRIAARARHSGRAIWYAFALVVLTNVSLLLLALMLGPIIAVFISAFAIPGANLAVFILGMVLLEQANSKQDSRLWRFEPAILALCCLLFGFGVFYAILAYWKRPI